MNVKVKVKEILEEQSNSRNPIALKNIPYPHELPMIKEGSERIIKNLSEGKRLLIVGDYDCDGICATTIIYDFFQTLGYGKQVEFIVPDRFVDGYGVSKNMVDYAINNLFDFIVTVDNGIGAKEAVKYATDNKIEVIITDHHTPGEQVPEVDIIINPKYDLGNFPFMEISGATVAWYLCAQINQDLKANVNMTQWLDLVGITVISDVMPLKSLNISFVHFAINAIKNKKRYVFELAFDSAKRAFLTETDIGFGFVPMINAVGRIDHAKHAVNMLLSKDKNFIKESFKYVVDINNKRKYLNEDLLNKILPEAEKQFNSGAKALIIKQEDLHEGIVGILAGKLAERYMRPSYVFGWNPGKGCWKGSGRTSGIIQLYDLTNNAAEHALGFGGHAGAVGVAIEKNNFDNWKNEIQKAANIFNPKDFIPIGPKPLLTGFKDIDHELLDLLNQYRPFGQEFPAPLFKTKAYISIIDSYKEGLHSKCLLIDEEGQTRNAWFFHDKGLINFENTTVEVLFFPEEVRTEKGKDIVLHAKINYLGE